MDIWLLMRVIYWYWYEIAEEGEINSTFFSCLLFLLDDLNWAQKNTIEIPEEIYGKVF